MGSGVVGARRRCNCGRLLRPRREGHSGDARLVTSVRSARAVGGQGARQVAYIGEESNRGFTVIPLEYVN
jgi:hypothetical protein